MVFELGADHGAWTEEFVAFQREDFGVAFFPVLVEAVFKRRLADLAARLGGAR